MPLQPPAAPLPGETCPGLSTWDAVPPHRPGTKDYNGAAMQNASGANGQAPPPNPGTMPTAGLFNGDERTMISVGKMVPNAILSISGDGAPVIVRYIAADSTSTPEDFVLTPVSAGILTIVYPNALFPPPVVNPTASLDGIIGGNTYAISKLLVIGAEDTTITVYTNVGGVPTWFPFTIEIR